METLLAGMQQNAEPLLLQLLLLLFLLLLLLLLVQLRYAAAPWLAAP